MTNYWQIKSFPKYSFFELFDIGDAHAKFVVEANLIQGVFFHKIFLFVKEILSF